MDFERRHLFIKYVYVFYTVRRVRRFFFSFSINIANTICIQCARIMFYSDSSVLFGRQLVRYCVVIVCAHRLRPLSITTNAIHCGRAKIRVKK